MEYVEERSVWHVMGNDDWVRGWRCLTGPENRQNVWMREDPAEKKHVIYGPVAFKISRGVTLRTPEALSVLQFISDDMLPQNFSACYECQVLLCMPLST